ncbi:hypothetical protein [Neobacillus mesonae]|uniref:Uncharacterized protein n=1 Tax=Neobacillus mesonae TaxID=1193713 RepID=A0A3Q9R122_9BACI|nr:hypothetical protein [Neobacillus mesonae]AZU63879.1 hypothetical protein CHR53_22965 [Neobacillus mesonae]MED4204600.1 hypothetical protein [Neobacillus mesonae]
MSGGLKFLLYLVSFFIPIVGIILGIIWMNDQELDKKAVGKNCLIVAIVSIVLSCVCWFALSAMSVLPAFSGY